MRSHWRDRPAPEGERGHAYITTVAIVPGRDGHRGTTRRAWRHGSGRGGDDCPGAADSAVAAGKPTLPFGKDKRAAKDVAQASRTLLDQLNLLRDEIGLSDPPIPTAPITAFEDDVPDLLPRVLRWHLRPDEELLALGAAKGRRWPVHRDESFVAVTDQRLLVADSNAFRTRGEVRIAVPLSDIRYVRFRPAANEGQKAGRLDVITPELDLHLTFDDWASEEDHQAEVARLAQLLRSSMSLPASEVPSSPLAGEHLAPQHGLPDDPPEGTSSEDPAGEPDSPQDS